MIRFFAATVCTLLAFASALTAPAFAARDTRALPMQFDIRTEGPAAVCGNHCRRWISAFGAITADTPRDFQTFAAGKELRGATIAFDSDGGSTLGALALGREIRRLELTTTVGRAVELPGDPDRWGYESKADCESMCAFLLLAGARRHVPADARVMVHQIWLGDRRDDPTAASYSAEDLVLVQRDIGRIAQYTVEMGASAELLDIALRIPPWEPMRELTREELQRLQFLTIDNPFDKESPLPSLANTRATSAAPASIVRDRTRSGRRAWNLLDGSNGTALTRRHPITVEGEEIGTFDITFACGASADNYLLSYSEWRRGNDAASPASLNNVTVRVGQRSLPLKVSSSVRNDGDQTELDTFASLSVPADFIKGLAGVSNRSVTISTSGGGADTSIRFGNTGLSQNFPLLAASCEKSLSAKAEPPQKKTGALAHAD
jgi:hypothetical protein